MKIDRLDVYKKYGGRCAYCGKELSVDIMQIDHVMSKQRAEYLWGSVEAYEHAMSCSIDDISNLMPACRSCKHFKGVQGLEHFRGEIENIPESLRKKDKLYRIGIDYGFFDTRERKVTFYFEKYSETYGRSL